MPKFEFIAKQNLIYWKSCIGWSLYRKNKKCLTSQSFVIYNILYTCRQSQKFLEKTNRKNNEARYRRGLAFTISEDDIFILSMISSSFALRHNFHDFWKKEERKYDILHGKRKTDARKCLSRQNFECMGKRIFSRKLQKIKRSEKRKLAEKGKGNKVTLYSMRVYIKSN